MTYEGYSVATSMGPRSLPELVARYLVCRDARSGDKPVGVQERLAILRPLSADTDGGDRSGPRRARAECSELPGRSELLRPFKADPGGGDRIGRSPVRPERLELQGRHHLLRAFTAHTIGGQ